MKRTKTKSITVKSGQRAGILIDVTGAGAKPKPKGGFSGPIIIGGNI